MTILGYNNNNSALPLIQFYSKSKLHDETGQSYIILLSNTLKGLKTSYIGTPTLPMSET